MSKRKAKHEGGKGSAESLETRLGKLRLFADMSEKEIADVIRQLGGTVRCFAKDEIVVYEGTKAKWVVPVLSGRLTVFESGASGVRHPVRVVEAGRLFGATMVTAKLILSEWVAGNVVKTTATAKTLNADGKTATLEVVKSKVVLRSFVVDFENGTLDSDGTRLMDLCEPTAATAETDVTTFVLEEVADGATNAYAYVTATYNAKKALFAFTGKLWDGTAVKGVTYALDRETKSGGRCLAPVLLTDKAKNAIYLELSTDGSWCRVLENGKGVQMGLDGMSPWSAGFFSAALKGAKLVQLLPTAQEGVVLTEGGETVQFRGIAVGSKKGHPVQARVVFLR